MTEDGIIVKFPEPVDCIRIQSQSDLAAAYERLGKPIPPFIVFVPCFQINDEWYYVFPHEQSPDITEDPVISTCAQKGE